MAWVHGMRPHCGQPRRRLARFCSTHVRSNEARNARHGSGHALISAIDVPRDGLDRVHPLHNRGLWADRARRQDQARTVWLRSPAYEVLMKSFFLVALALPLVL